MSTDATCMLTIVRDSKYADCLRRYKIFVNGAQVGTIARNSVLDLQVPSGSLTIEARIDWCRSHPLKIEAAPDQKIEVKVANPWKSLAIFAIIFDPGRYLALWRR